MKKYFRRVLDLLKTRKEIKALGFSRKELKGIAAKVADKLDLKDDATEEEVTEAIDDAVDSIIPFLEISQTVADRRLQSYKDAHPADGDDDDDDDPDDEPEGEKGRKSPSTKGKKGKKAEESDDSDIASQIAKALAPLTETMQGLNKQIAELKEGKVADSRKSRLEEMVKDTGKFGERTLKAFARMSFKTDEDFEDFLDEVEADLEAENKERSDKGLETLGKPVGAVPGKTGRKDDDELMSDDEVKALAKL